MIELAFFVRTPYLNAVNQLKVVAFFPMSLLIFSYSLQFMLVIFIDSSKRIYSLINYAMEMKIVAMLKKLDDESEQKGRAK